MFGTVPGFLINWICKIIGTGIDFVLAYLGSGGAFKHPLFLIGLVVVLVGGLYYIHSHRKKYELKN